MPKSEERQRRMQIRRDAGNRVVALLPTRERGPDYLVAHACFKCRASFKRQLRDGELTCPSCGGVAYEMGRSFKAPSKTDSKQWKKVRLLYAHGFRFWSYGNDAPPLPQTLREVEQFVAENPGHPCRSAEPIEDLLSEI